MLVGYGDNGVLIIALTEAQLQELRAGVAQTFKGTTMVVTDIVILGWPTMEECLAGERIDHSRKPS